MTSINSLSQQTTTLSSILNQDSSSKTSSLSSILSGSGKSSSTVADTTTSSGSDKITLSKEAQEILANLNKKDYGFTLTTKQQQQIQDILTKYKGSAQTSETAALIQKDLKKIKLDSTTLTARETAKENLAKKPLRGYLMSLLNGTANTSTVNTKAIAAKAEKFNAQILADFKALNTSGTVSTTA